MQILVDHKHRIHYTISFTVHFPPLIYPKVQYTPTTQIPTSSVHHPMLIYPNIQCTTNGSNAGILVHHQELLYCTYTKKSVHFPPLMYPKIQCTINRSNTQKFSVLPTSQLPQNSSALSIDQIPKNTVQFPPLIYCTLY